MAVAIGTGLMFGRFSRPSLDAWPVRRSVRPPWMKSSLWTASASSMRSPQPRISHTQMPAALATCSALVAVALARIRGERVDSTAKLPFGAFLCPALWLVFFASELQS